MEDEKEEAEETSEEEEATGEAAEGGTVTIGTLSDPVLLLPTHSSDTASGDIEDIIFNQLVRIDEDIVIQPELAKDWENSEDGLTYTFEIHEGVTLHDVEPLTDDVITDTYKVIIY